MGRDKTTSDPSAALLGALARLQVDGSESASLQLETLLREGGDSPDLNRKRLLNP